MQLAVGVDTHFRHTIIVVVHKQNSGFARLRVHAFLEAVGTNVLIDNRNSRCRLQSFQVQRVLQRRGTADAAAIAIGWSNTLDHHDVAG
jgi:hypothetical protein